MQGDVFNTDEVLAAGEVFRKCEGNCGETLGGEGDTLPAVRHRGDLVDLEPHVARAIPGRDVGAGGCLGEVNVGDTGVRDVAVGGNADLRARSNVYRLCGRVRLSGVAAKCFTRHVGDLLDQVLYHEVNRSGPRERRSHTGPLE